jgi:hypothetical protein
MRFAGWHRELFAVACGRKRGVRCGGGQEPVLSQRENLWREKLKAVVSIVRTDPFFDPFLNKQRLSMGTFLFCQVFALALLLFAIFLSNRAQVQRRVYLNENSELMTKFGLKFHDAQTTSDNVLQLKLMDGFVAHM